MANRSVQLYLYAGLPGIGWRYCRAVFGAKNKPKLTPRKTLEELAKGPGKEGAEAKFLLKLEKLLSKVKERDRAVFLATAQKLAAAKR